LVKVGPYFPVAFLLIPKGFWGSFWKICVFEEFASWDLGHEADPKSAKGLFTRRGADANANRPLVGKLIRKVITPGAPLRRQKGNKKSPVKGERP
jgi:hypothetical protein